MVDVLRKKTGNLHWRKLLLGVTVGMIAVLAATGAGAWLLNAGTVVMPCGRYLAAASLMAGTALGCAAGGGGEGRLVRCMAIAAGMWLSLLILNLTLYDSRLAGVMAGSCLIYGTAVACALIGGKKEGRRRHPAKRRYG